MIPDIGSEWVARDGRRMRVKEVIVPPNPADMPWCKLDVLNAGKGMRRSTEMSTVNFGSEKFLRPAK